MEEKTQNVYQNIRNYCDQHGISLQAFEESCGIGNGVLAKWGRGKMAPTLKSLEKLEATTKIPVASWLMKGAFDGVHQAKHRSGDGQKESASA